LSISALYKILLISADGAYIAVRLIDLMPKPSAILLGGFFDSLIFETMDVLLRKNRSTESERVTCLAKTIGACLALASEEIPCIHRNLFKTP